MAISNAVEQVVLGLEMCTPEALAEAVIDALEPAVRRTRKSRIENAHAGGQATNVDANHEVVVVSHQREGKHAPVVRFRDGLQRPKEHAAELVVEDDVLVVAARDYMVVGPGFLVSRAPTHVPHGRRVRVDGAPRVTVLSRCWCNLVSLAWHRDMPATVVLPPDMSQQDAAARDGWGAVRFGP